MKQHRYHHLLVWSILILLVTLLGGCTAIKPDSVQPGATTSVEPAPSVAINQRAALSIQLGLDPSAIEIVGATPVTWPDACLGKPDPTELCAQAATPGYRITLAVNGAEYIYHTDEEGSSVRLAGAPAPQIDELLVEWTLTDDSGCNMVQIGNESVVFGRCQSTLMSVPLRYAARQADLAEFVQSFAPFAADAPAGHVEFNGSGAAEATPAQQRMIAEWAQLVGLETRTDSSGASGSMVLDWNRIGGSAGFCDNLTVLRTGEVTFSSCRGQTPEPGQFRLPAEELATLYNWMDTFANFQYEQTSPAQSAAITSALTVTLVFVGGGEQAASELEQALLIDFAQNLFNEGRMAAGAIPTACLPPVEAHQILLQEEAGYCLLYPAAYSLWQQDVGTMAIISDTVMNHSTPRASISVEEAAGRTLDEVVDQLLADYAPPGFNIEPQSIPVAGVEAMMLDEVPGQDFTRRVVLIHNGRLYSFFFAPIGDAGTETRQQAESLYQTVMASFRLFTTTPAADSTMSDDTVLLWEGQPLFAEEENACGRLAIDRYDAATIGACGESEGETHSLGATHAREWLELQTRFWGPTEVGLIGHHLRYRPDGEAFGGAWQRALLSWTQLVHAELATGRVSASGATAMSWFVGAMPDQPEVCQHLTVLSYGYAYAATVPCAGGPTQTQVGGWLTDAEMIQFDMWLHQYGDLYVDDNYLAGRGERIADEAEQAELATWAEGVYARLAAHPIASAQPDSAEWQSYQADSGYEIGYPLSRYSLRPAPQSPADVLFPGVRVVEPNDAFVYGQPGQSTYKLSIAVRANEQGRTLDPGLLANSALLAYTPDVLAGQTIQEIQLDGVPALRVDDLPVGPAGVTTQIVAIHQDRIYELMVEPYSVTTNLATPYVASVDNAANQALMEAVLATFRFVE